MKKYDKMANKNIKRERHSLSHTRYNKMKAMIMREVRDAIQEAEHEPTASVADINMIQSMIDQNEEDHQFGIGAGKHAIINRDSMIM
jgi:hypothetical protein